MSSRLSSPAHLGARQVPVSDLVAHPLNSNVMSPEIREKLKVNIARTKRYPFLVVRPHPEEAGCYQVLDGHHRLDILRELGHSKARCDVWEVDDREAKLLLATLNRLEGQDQPLKRAELLHALLADMNVSDLAGLLPEDEKQIEELHALLEFPADEVAALLEEEADRAERSLPKVIHFVVTPEQEEIIERAVEAASDGTPGRDRRARGLLNMARRFLKETAHEPKLQ